MTPAEDANTNELNEITSNYLEEFQDKETRHIYVDDFLNAKIATQIKALREQRGWTQAELAERAGMKQERISVLEDVNYTSWTLNVLRRLAEAFDLRINVSFEDFGSFLKEFSEFSRTALERTSFENDLVFKKDKKSSQVANEKETKSVGDLPRTTEVRFKVVKGSTSAGTKETPYQPPLRGFGFDVVFPNTAPEIIPVEEPETTPIEENELTDKVDTTKLDSGAYKELAKTA